MNNKNSQIVKKKEKIQTDEDQHFIGHYQKAPEFMKDNEAITHGYRINFNTPKKIFRSLFMVHNQSVNIWTHLFPALIIIAIIIFYIIILATSLSITDQLINYKHSFQQGFNKYLNTMENFTILQEMSRMKDLTQQEFLALKASAIQSYEHFTNQIKTQIDKVHNQVASKMSQVKEQMMNQFKKNIKEMERAKYQFEKIILPNMFGELNSKLNSTYLQKFKEKIQQIKQQIDSDTYKYIQLSRDKIKLHQVSRWPLVVFLFSAMICLMCSSFFHLCYPMSPKHYKLFSRLDYAGVSILIAGSGFPIIYYGMYCNLYMAAIYLTLSTVLGILVFGLSLTQWFHRPQNLHIKGLTYALYGVHYLLPAGHILIDLLFFKNNGDPYNFLNVLPTIGTAGIAYLVGVFIYVKRCPQRRNPGKYNVCGHSHQIWHLCVVTGVVFTYIAAIAALDTRKQSVCPIN